MVYEPTAKRTILGDDKGKKRCRKMSRLIANWIEKKVEKISNELISSSQWLLALMFHPGPTLGIRLYCRRSFLPTVNTRNVSDNFIEHASFPDNGTVSSFRTHCLCFHSIISPCFFFHFFVSRNRQRASGTKRLLLDTSDSMKFSDWYQESFLRCISLSIWINSNKDTSYFPCGGS